MQSTESNTEPSATVTAGIARPAGNPWGGGGGTHPWGQSPAPVLSSLKDVMSEELAKKLQTEEEEKSKNEQASLEEDFSWVTENSSDISNDLLLAQHLQHQFDQEHDKLLRLEEDKLNGTSKVKLTFTNYQSVHPALQGDEYQSEEDEYLEAGYDEEEDKPIHFKNGVSGKGKNMISKHDANLSGKKNANRIVEQFPPEFDTGDATKVKMRLPNHVYNKLKIHSIKESKRANKLHEKKEHSTVVMAMDEKTRLILYKLTNSGILEEVHGVFSTGKESVVLHANGGSMTNQLVPAECAVKVFKTTLVDFKNRIQYVKGDVRFFKDDFKKHNPRRIIKIWAEKEDHNLRRLERAGIPVPKCITLKKNVLVMSFIGENQVPAPKLKEAKLSYADMQIAYEQCIENMKNMYSKANLVHADLSEYNMLWFKDQLYFIDVSQAVEKQHPLAMVFLLRDCGNVVDFFSKNGVPRVPTKYELFNEISGLNLSLEVEGNDFLQQIEEFEKDEEKLRFQVGKDYPFEYFFDKATKERLAQNEDREYESSEEESSGDSNDEVEEASETGEVKKDVSQGKSSNVTEANTKPDKGPGNP